MAKATGIFPSGGGANPRVDAGEGSCQPALSDSGMAATTIATPIDEVFFKNCRRFIDSSRHFSMNRVLPLNVKRSGCDKQLALHRNAARMLCGKHRRS